MKIIVGMSGGIDSAVAAFLLKKQGYEVSGAFYKLFESSKEESRCCDLDSALYIGKLIGINVATIDVSAEFKKEIIDNFLFAYGSGITPNPCTVCNEKIKFGLGLKRAQEFFGSLLFATGHYVIIDKKEGIHLMKAKDKMKDQSYMLWRLSREQLSNTTFPLGMYTKDEVREIAKAFKMPPKKESEDVCFVSGRLNVFLRENLGESKGVVVDTSGKILGEHRGAYLYTIGQRSGLNIPYKFPLYVVAVDVISNTVTVGAKEECFFAKSLISDTNFIEEWNGEPVELTGKVRYRNEEKKCILRKEGESILVEFAEPQFAIAGGQSLVLYDKERVFGGGVIQRAFR